jgi:hypothetical protein
MANNSHRYGFRWVGSLEGGCCPKPLEFLVATAYQAQVSATNVDLSIGDPVQFNVGAPGTGFIELAGGAGSPSILYGVIVGFSNVKVGLPLKGRPFSRLPGGTTWTTEENASKVLVIPFGRNIWEVDVLNNGASQDTLTEYRALTNRCADLVYSLDSSNADFNRAGPYLNMTGVTDDTADFRILGVSGTRLNQDFSGNFVKMRVVVNESGEAPYVTDPGV